MTLLSERLLTTLPTWRKLSGPNQLTSWQQFVSDVQEHINPLVSQDHLRTLALQLHSMGEVRVHLGLLLPECTVQGWWDMSDRPTTDSKGLYTRQSRNNKGDVSVSVWTNADRCLNFFLFICFFPCLITSSSSSLLGPSADQHHAE